jgi:phospholipid transport system substrate-binding protein
VFVVGLVILLFLPPWIAVAGTAGERLQQSINRLLEILKDPRLKDENNKNRRREKLKAIIYQRFDFNEMAKRSLGAEWRRRKPEEREEFVKLFADLLEQSYLDKVESYNGEKVQFRKEREEGDYAEVDTKLIDSRGRDFSIDYRLHKVDGDWKVYDVVIEDVSLVNNYRAQFNRILSHASYAELINRMKQKRLSAPGASS